VWVAPLEVRHHQAVSRRQGRYPETNRLIGVLLCDLGLLSDLCVESGGRTATSAAALSRIEANRRDQRRIVVSGAGKYPAGMTGQPRQNAGFNADRF
jgi:hypothetical protein